MVDVLETVRAVFEPLRDIDPNYEFVGEEDPWVEVYDFPRDPLSPADGVAYASNLTIGERQQPRLERRHGYRVTVTIFGASLDAECGEFGSTTSQIASLVDSIMEYVPENLAWAGHDSAWPGCLPGHPHPPDLGPGQRGGLAWICPASGETVRGIAMVP